VNAREVLRACFDAALLRVDATRATERAWQGLRGASAGPESRVHVLAAGKAAASMAAGVLGTIGPALGRGLVVAKDAPDPTLDLAACAVRVAGHPVPDARSVRAGAAAVDFVASTPAQDLLLVLLSGGASALLSSPVEGVGVAELSHLTEALLRAGAPIEELNTVRRRLQRAAGGRLAQARVAGRTIVLAISDVLGDDLATIASGPFSPDPGSDSAALAVIERRGVGPEHAGVVAHLRAAARGQGPDVAGRFAHVETHLVARNRDALAGALACAGELGLDPIVVSDALRGEARIQGRRIGALAQSCAGLESGLLLFGGETTVTVRGAGRGGRNMELALAAAEAIAGRPGVALLAAGTDGSDGPTDAAGAFVDGETIERGARRGLDAADHLRRNDSYAFFEGEGGLLRTGPTGTNVMDLALVLVRRRG